MSPTIREIEEADVPAVIALWHEAGVARPWNDPATDIAFARREPHGTVLVAELDGRVVASAMAGEDGHRGWLYYVAVAPGHQGSGLGRLMVEAGEAWLAARGVWKVQLLVRRENAGVLGFYDHLGYRDTHAVCLQKVIAKG
ncbi:acetyltransferase [Methylobacterium tarhaniae]|uniref:Acetyltransferase n=1 Tax=Methylobacterium tarhaniae TaxID=1187852 RepID=A0A0J6SW74_9HYPH|nr:GNAT family acetyltransferase [Methylobacterium tarhaniae]KMO37812.1 acetyltransferase [Methylobacterium tarhaniae]